MKPAAEHQVARWGSIQKIGADTAEEVVIASNQYYPLGVTSTTGDFSP